MDWIDRVGWLFALIGSICIIGVIAVAVWLLGSLMVLGIEYGGWPVAAFLNILSGWLGYVLGKL